MVVFILLCHWGEQEDYLEISDVSEEEADKGEGQTPLSHSTDQMGCVTLQDMAPLIPEETIRNKLKQLTKVI